ncbi:MAG: hypothetical protein IPK64_00460 [bacterium]|nr:hypothetical protein [bacterium]
MIGLAATAAMCAGATAASDDVFPAPFTAAQIDSIVAAHQDADAVELVRCTSLHVAYDASARSLSGTLVEYRDITLLDQSAVEDLCRVFAVDGPFRRFDSFSANVIPADGRDSYRINGKKLDWIAFTPDRGGVVMLEETFKQAILPGLRRGDRLQTIMRYESHAHHGLHPEQLSPFGYPVAHCSAELVMPTGHRLAWTARGDARLLDKLRYHEQERGRETVRSWTLTGLRVAGDDGPGWPDDPGQVTVLRHVTGVEAGEGKGALAVGADWGAIARAYRERTAECFEPDKRIRELAHSLTDGRASALERIDAVYAWVQGNTRYLGLFRELGGIIPERAALVASKGYGDCKGLGSLLIALLRAAGIEAWPVLVRTSHVGPLSIDLPNPSQFNHFIVWADDGGDGVWLDATLTDCPAGHVYPHDAASPVLQLRPGHEGLVTLPVAIWSEGERRYAITGQLDAQRHLEIESRLAASGIEGLLLRSAGSRLAPAEREAFLNHLLRPVTIAFNASPRESNGADPAAAIASPGNDGEASAPETLAYSARTSQPLAGSAASVFLPRILAPLSLPSPVLDLPELVDRQESWRIVIPAGWTVSPDSLRVATASLEWHRTVQQRGDTLCLDRRVRWDHGAVRDLDLTERRRVWEDALKTIRDDERGHIAIRVAR